MCDNPARVAPYGWLPGEDEPPYCAECGEPVGREYYSMSVGAVCDDCIDRWLKGAPYWFVLLIHDELEEYKQERSKNGLL